MEFDEHAGDQIDAYKALRRKFGDGEFAAQALAAFRRGDVTAHEVINARLVLSEA